MKYSNVVVAGGGVLGSQIAFQAAYCGFNVTIWLRSEGSIGRTQPKIDHLKQTYIEAIEKMAEDKNAWCAGLADEDTFDKEECLKKVENAYANLKLELDMAKAVADADLVIESLSEDPKAKIAFYQQMAPLLPEKTVIVTNSSTMVPSAFAQYTGRPEKYLALHFANEIWKNNTAEIMGHAGTEGKYYDEVVEFAGQIGMIPLKLHKEQPGYILNSLLVPFLNAGEALYANDVADPETIDLTWSLATGAPLGPFRILDIVGLETAYNIVCMDPAAKDPETTPGKIAKRLKEKIDAGKKGVCTGEGFYKYTK